MLVPLLDLLKPKPVSSTSDSPKVVPPAVTPTPIPPVEVPPVEVAPAT